MTTNHAQDEVFQTLEKLGQELYRRRQQAKQAKEAAEAIDYLVENKVFTE
jgi:hypothetical protein